jgi:hypothetical protein
MQTVFPLQITQNFHRAPGLEIVREFAALLIDPQRHDMEMLSGNVLVLENDIGLFAVTHALHVLAGNVPEPFVCQSVFRRRIQRDMEDRIGRPSVSFEVGPEALHAGIDIHSPVFIEGFEHLLPEEHFGLILIHFLLVVVQGSAGRGARSYIRNHSLACFARLRISILRAFSSRVRCSNAAI